MRKLVSIELFLLRDTEVSQVVEKKGLDNTHLADLYYIYFDLIILITFIYIYLHSLFNARYTSFRL